MEKEKYLFNRSNHLIYLVSNLQFKLFWINNRTTSTELS